MKTFQLVRDEDPSGISGTGIVAEGVEFDDGKTVIQWIVPGKPSSLVVWDDLADAMLIHGHNGLTRLEYIEGDAEEVRRLRRWKTEASEVMMGLQDLGRALDLRPGERITGEAALESVKRLKARIAELESD